MAEKKVMGLMLETEAVFYIKPMSRGEMAYQDIGNFSALGLPGLSNACKL